MKKIIKIVIFMTVIFMIVFGFQSAQSYSEEEELLRIKETIWTLCLKCYSIEGIYQSPLTPIYVIFNQLLRFIKGRRHYE